MPIACIQSLANAERSQNWIYVKASLWHKWNYVKFRCENGCAVCSLQAENANEDCSDSHSHTQCWPCHVAVLLCTNIVLCIHENRHFTRIRTGWREREGRKPMILICHICQIPKGNIFSCGQSINKIRIRFLCTFFCRPTCPSTETVSVLNHLVNVQFLFSWIPFDPTATSVTYKLTCEPNSISMQTNMVQTFRIQQLKLSSCRCAETSL